jgi:MFS family permease
MDTSNNDVQVYSYRWIVLLAFMFINVTMQILWICFAPVTVEAAAYFDVSDEQVGLLAMIFMIVFIPLAIPASWAIDKWGFKKAVGLGAVLMGLFGLLRGLYTGSYAATMFFTVGIALGQPFLLNAFTKVAAQWFPLQERATAVALATVASFLGVVIGQVFTPTLVTEFGFGSMLMIYGVVTALSSVLFLALAREEPPTPASPPEYEERALILDGFRQVLRQVDFYYLAFALFIGNGIFNGIVTWIEVIVRPKGMDINQAGLLGGVMLLGGIVGAAAIPPLSDRYRKRKLVVMAGLALGIPGLLGIAAFSSYALLLVSFFVMGLFMSGVAPVAYQYGAEITYPAPEGTSNGLFVLAGQISVLIVSLMGWSNDQFDSFTPSLLALAGLVLVSIGLLAVADESPMMQVD